MVERWVFTKDPADHHVCLYTFTDALPGEFSKASLSEKDWY